MARSGKAYKDRSARARAARRNGSTPQYEGRAVAQALAGEWYVVRTHGGKVYDENDDLVEGPPAGLAIVDERFTAPAPERDWPKFLGMAKSIVKLEERRHAELSEQRFGGEWRKQNKNADGLVRKGRKFGDQAGVAK